MNDFTFQETFFDQFAADADGRILSAVVQDLQKGRKSAVGFFAKFHGYEDVPVEADDDREIPLLVAAYDVALSLLPDIWIMAQGAEAEGQDVPVFYLTAEELAPAGELSIQDQTPALLNVAYSALRAGIVQGPRIIFHLLQRTHTDLSVGYVGEALLLMETGDFQQALDLLEGRALTADDGCDQAEAAYLMALYHGGRAEHAADFAARLLNDRDDSSQAKAIARLLFVPGAELDEAAAQGA